MITIRTWGPLALFADPHFRADPYSYDVSTPSAGKGIFRSIYWKPEFEWEIEEISVLNPIRRDVTKLKSLNNASDVHDTEAGRTLQTVSYLVDVNYLIRARIVLNPRRARRALGTYVEEAKRRMSEGQQFRQPHFGRREYTASYEIMDPSGPLPTPIPVSRNLGSMLFDLVPVDLGKAGGKEHPDRFEPVFFRAEMVNGVITVPRSLYDEHRERMMAVRNLAHSVKKEDDPNAA